MPNNTKRFSGRELTDNAQGDPVIHPGRGNQLLSGLSANHGIFGLLVQSRSGNKEYFDGQQEFFNRNRFFYQHELYQVLLCQEFSIACAGDIQG